MSDKKISQLNSATTPLSGTEVIPIVQDSETKKIAINDTGFVLSQDITQLVVLTQVEYDAIPSPDLTTLYIISG